MAAHRGAGALGRLGEEAAARWYEERGCTVVARNWRCATGEIDLVVLDRRAGAFVICEVKTRSGKGFGTGFEAVTAQKLRRLRLLAGRWMAEARPKGVPARELRIDVASVTPAPGGGFVVEVLESVG